MKKTIEISNIIKELGVSANLLGYGYIRCAVSLILQDASYVREMTTKLYVEIAKQHQTRPTSVERAIRHAIEKAWNNGNPDFQYKLFGYSVGIKKGKPTNSEFLATVADYIGMCYEKF